MALSVLAIGVNGASLAALASAVTTVPYSRLIASLACSDILIGLTLLAYYANLIGNPLHEVTAATADRLRSRCAAVIVHAANVTAVNISLLNLLGMAVDHYIAILRPLRYPVLLSRRRSRLMIAALWSLAVVLGYSEFIVAAARRAMRAAPSRLNFCEYVFWHRQYSSEFATATLAFVCLTALTVVYARIYTAVRQLQGLGARGAGGTGAGGAGVSGSNKALYTTLLVLATFLICWVPNFLYEMTMMVKVRNSASGDYKLIMSYFKFVIRFFFLVRTVPRYLSFHYNSKLNLWAV